MQESIGYRCKGLVVLFVAVDLLIPQRSERSGSSMLVPFPSECRESKVRYPAPWGPRGGFASAFQGLPWGIDTFHYWRGSDREHNDFRDQCLPAYRGLIARDSIYTLPDVAKVKEFITEILMPSLST